MRKAYLFVVFAILISCNDKPNCTQDFDSVTSLLHQLEENNRLELRETIVNYHLQSERANYLNESIVGLYDLLDVVTENLLNKSGGYDPSNASLIGGLKKDIPLDILNEYNLRASVKKEVKALSSRLEKNPVPHGQLIFEDIESILYVILEDKWTDDSLEKFTVAKLYLALMLMQNRLLTTEVKYFELLSETQNAEANGVALLR